MHEIGLRKLPMTCFTIHTYLFYLPTYYTCLLYKEASETADSPSREDRGWPGVDRGQRQQRR